MSRKPTPDPESRFIGSGALGVAGCSLPALLIAAFSREWWLPRLKDHIAVLNWSERNKWRNTLPVRIFRCFGVADDNFNFNPVVILFQGLRYPLVYRYHDAFRDAKHGRPEALHQLEQHMFAQFESPPYAGSSTRASR